LGAVLLADAHHLAEDLDVEAVTLGLGEDFLDLLGHLGLLDLQALDAFDDALELACAAWFSTSGWAGGVVGHGVSSKLENGGWRGP